MSRLFFVTFTFICMYLRGGRIAPSLEIQNKAISISFHVYPGFTLLRHYTYLYYKPGWGLCLAFSWYFSISFLTFARPTFCCRLLYNFPVEWTLVVLTELFMSQVVYLFLFLRVKRNDGSNQLNP